VRRAGNPIIDGRPGVLVSTREGGSLLDYADEDPKIREDYLTALLANGLEADMPEELYSVSGRRGLHT
jgi:hypothetical protein